MSYARFGWDGSDVYLFVASEGLECCGCLLQKREWIDDDERAIFKGYMKAVGEIVPHVFKTTDEMITHLQKHTDAGHCVPDDVVPALLEDAEENEHFIETGEWTKR